MNTITKGFYVLLSILFLTLFSQTVWAAESLPQSQTFHLTGEIHFSTLEGGFYGIIGDDGKKYQPTNLPRKFKKDGLAIKFDAKRKDVISTFQWGTIVELSNAAPITTSISSDERRAILLLLKRLDAFNTKDLAKLQDIDTVSRQLTKEQFDSWVSKYNNFTLQYVDIFDADSTSITGSCYYTRELTNGMTLHGNTDLAAMTFTLSQTSQGWKLTQSGALSNPAVLANTDALADLKQKAFAKYNNNNLAALFQ